MRGRIAWLFGVTDILARKALEQMLHSPPDRENRTMQGLYEQAFCGANIAFWAWEKSGDRSCFHSTYLYELLEMPEPPEPANSGTPPDTASDKIFEHPVRRVIHPDDLERYDSEISGGVLEYRVILSAGKVKYLREHRHQARDDNGVVTWRYGTIQDITDQEMTRQTLVQTQRIGAIGIWQWSVSENRMISCSEECARIYGMTVDEVLKRMDYSHVLGQIIHPDDSARIKREYDEADRKGTSYATEYRIILPDGEIRHVEDIGEPFVMLDDKSIGQRGVVRDVTERAVAVQKLNKRMELGRLLYEIATSSDVTESIEATFLDCITKVCQYKNWPVGHVFVPAGDDKPEFVSSGIWYDSDSERFETFHHIASTVARGPGESFIGRILTSGEPDWIEDIALDKSFIGAEAIASTGIRSGFGVPIKCDGEIIAIAEFYTAESEAMDHELIETLKHIAHVIGRVARRFENESKIESARLVAEHSNRAKSKFLSSMSHELRTPMNAILGFAQILKMNEQNNYTERQSTAVDHILQSGKHLMDLLNDVLELNKIESGNTSIRLEQVDTREVIGESLSNIQSLAGAKGIKLLDKSTKKSLPVLWTDRSLATQALGNLLSNAVKYNTVNGKVIISCKPQNQTTLRILVADTGPGIPPDQHGDLFKPFIRLGRESGDIEGTGIGLTITRDIIELLGGHIGFESTPGSSSTFWLDFPIRQPENQPQFQQQFNRQNER